MKKHVNPKDLLRKVYTEQGGVKEYNKNQRALGALMFAGTILIIRRIAEYIDDIAHMEIKAAELSQKEDN